jgi:hypothetical protein
MPNHWFRIRAPHHVHSPPLFQGGGDQILNQAVRYIGGVVW